MQWPELRLFSGKKEEHEAMVVYIVHLNTDHTTLFSRNHTTYTRLPSKIQPPGGNSYFSGADANFEYMFYFQMTGGGLPSDDGSMPYCTFAVDRAHGNAAGQGEITGDSCFPIGLVNQQSWEIDTTQDPQVIRVTFSGGQEGRQTLLKVTCDPTANDPTFFVLGETRTLVYVFPA